MNRSNSHIRSAARFVATSILLLGLSAAPVQAQDSEPAWDDEPTWSAESEQKEPAKRQSSDSWISVRGGLGFTADPNTFLMSIDVPFTITELFAAGPQLRLGVSDDEVYLAATVQGYVTPRIGGDLDVIRPYGSLGLGIAFLDKDGRRRGRDDEDVDFLLTPGFGVEYAFDDAMFVGTGVQLDVIPGGVAGERFVFSWQVVTFRAAF